MTRRWFHLRALTALVLLLSLSVIMIHWHQEGAGQDCGLCYTHQMPGLRTESHAPVIAPRVLEWRFLSAEPASESQAFVPAHPGRAPPRSFSSI